MTEAAEKKREPNWGSGMALGVVFGVVMSILLDNWAFIGIGIALSAAFAYGIGTEASDDDTTDHADGEDPAGGDVDGETTGGGDAGAGPDDANSEDPTEENDNDEDSGHAAGGAPSPPGSGTS